MEGRHGAGVGWRQWRDVDECRQESVVRKRDAKKEDEEEKEERKISGGGWLSVVKARAESLLPSCASSLSLALLMSLGKAIPIERRIFTT